VYLDLSFLALAGFAAALLHPLPSKANKAQGLVATQPVLVSALSGLCRVVIMVLAMSKDVFSKIFSASIGTAIRNDSSLLTAAL
jgi:hypothetical protein